MEPRRAVVVLQPEPLLPPVAVRAEVRVPAAMQEPLVVVTDRAATAVMQPVPVVHGVPVMQTSTALVLEVVALAAVDRMLVVPLVLEVIVPAMHLVPQMPLVLQVIVAAVLEMPLMFQVVVAPVLQMPVMLQVAVMLQVPFVLEVVVAAVVMPHMMPMMDPMPVMATVTPVMPAPQRRTDLGACCR